MEGKITQCMWKIHWIQGTYERETYQKPWWGRIEFRVNVSIMGLIIVNIFILLFKVHYTKLTNTHYQRVQSVHKGRIHVAKDVEVVHLHKQEYWSVNGKCQLEGNKGKNIFRLMETYQGGSNRFEATEEIQNHATRTSHEAQKCYIHFHSKLASARFVWQLGPILGVDCVSSRVRS